MSTYRIVVATVIAGTLLALASAASAVPLTLTGPIQGNTLGPQSASNSCIIAGTQCQQPAGFGFNNFTSSGAISSYNMFSTTPTANVADGVQGTRTRSSRSMTSRTTCPSVWRSTSTRTTRRGRLCSCSKSS